MADCTIPSLSYARFASNWGIAVEVTAEYTRVIVPPVPSWRLLTGWHRWGIIGLFTLTCSQSFLLFKDSLNVFTMGLPWVANGVPLLFLTALAYRRLFMWMCFTITRDRLIFVQRGWLGTNRMTSWRRCDLVEARYSAASGGLLLRIGGQDVKHKFIAPDRRISECVCREIENALSRQYVEVDVDALAVSEIGKLDAPRSRYTRTHQIAAIVSVLILGIGVVMLLMPTKFAWFGCYVVLFSAFPVGWAFGTQPREFYP